MIRSFASSFCMALLVSLCFLWSSSVTHIISGICQIATRVEMAVINVLYLPFLTIYTSGALTTITGIHSLIEWNRAALCSRDNKRLFVLCSEIRARYHPNPTPDRWPLESLPLGSETGIQVSAVVGIGDHLGRQLPVSLLVPVAVTSVDTTLLPTKFWRRNRVEPEVGALVSILKFGNPQASVIGIGGRLEGSGSLSPSERWFHYS